MVLFKVYDFRRCITISTFFREKTLKWTILQIYLELVRWWLERKKSSLTAHSILTVLEKRKNLQFQIDHPIRNRFILYLLVLRNYISLFIFIVVRWWLFLFDAVILLSHQVQSTVILYCVSLYISVHSIVTWLSHVLFCYLA